MNQLKGIWKGLTVCVIGAGPDVTQELIDSVKRDKTVVVNRAIRYAPDADMFVALDPHHPFWEAAADFKGICVIGCPDTEYDAVYVGGMHERVVMGPGHVIEIRNNALAAIRIAEMAGAARIVLLGFDPERYEETHAHTGFRGLVQGLEQITAELRSKGIEVERIDSPEQFPGKPAERRGDTVTGDGSGTALPPIDPATFPVRAKRSR